MNINIRQVIIISLVIIILSIFVLCIPWIILMIGGQFSSNPASPQITYSEFPICLEYEIEDRHFKVEDTLVCEFDGFGFDEGKGKFRKWKSYLKSGNTRITLFKDDTIEIYYFPIKEDSRLPGVFMGDAEYYSGGTGDTFPDAWYTYNFEDKTTNDYIISADEMMKNYNIRLIKWVCSSPIENKFDK